MWRLSKSSAAMKTTQLLAASALLLLAASTALAGDGSSYRFLKTNSGKVYTNCLVFKTDPDGVIISHQNGGAKLLFADLSEESRNALGYDPKREADYLKERAEQKRKNEEELWKYRTEVAKAAYATESVRLQTVAMQNVDGGYGYGGYGGYAGGYGLGYGLDGFYGFGGYGAGGYGAGGYGYGYGSNCGYGNGYGYNGGLGYGAGNCGYGYGLGNGIACSPLRFGFVTRGGTNFLPATNCNSRDWQNQRGWQNQNGRNHGGGSHNNRNNCGPLPLNVIGRSVIAGPARCAPPLATPAMGCLTPSFGGGGKH